MVLLVLSASTVGTKYILPTAESDCGPQSHFFLINYWSFLRVFFFNLLPFLCACPFCSRLSDRMGNTLQYCRTHPHIDQFHFSLFCSCSIWSPTPGWLCLAYPLILVEHILPELAEKGCKRCTRFDPLHTCSPHLVFSRSDIICTSEFGSYCFLASSVPTEKSVHPDSSCFM